MLFSNAESTQNIKARSRIHRSGIENLSPETVKHMFESCLFISSWGYAIFDLSGEVSEGIFGHF